jgi:uncharacterized protein (TIGR00296 family)
LLTLEEGTLVVKAAREAFLAFLRKDMQLQIHEKLPSPVAKNAGAYVRVGVLSEQDSEGRDIVLGFTGYPMPHRSLYRTVIDASESIAARVLDRRIDEAELSFEVTVLSPPELLRGGPSVKIVSNLKLGRDAVMVALPGFKRAIVLPQTAVEKCKNEVDLLSECCMAAGLMADAWITSPDIFFYKFEAQIFRERGSQKRVAEISLE